MNSSTFIPTLRLAGLQHIGYCMDRLDFGPAFRLEGGNIYGQGIWAPCIRYHKETFYIFSNINGVGLQVFRSKSITRMGEGHHLSKIHGKYYDVSAIPGDPVDQMVGRADSIDGPWEVASMVQSESMGVTGLAPARALANDRGLWIHQGGMCDRPRRMMRGDTMLMSLTNHRYLATKPNAPGPVTVTALGPTPARRSGECFKWKRVE